jgi:hypothetical protein
MALAVQCLSFLENLKNVIDCGDVQEMKFLLSECLHEKKSLIKSIMIIFNRALSRLIWSFLKQPEFDINQQTPWKVPHVNMFSASIRSHTLLTLAANLQKLEITKLLLKMPTLDINLTQHVESRFGQAFGFGNVQGNVGRTALEIAVEKENFEVNVFKCSFVWDHMLSTSKQHNIL